MMEFITALRDNIRDCDYSSLQDSLLRDRIIAGVCSTTLCNKLLQTANLTLQKCVDICELSEFDATQLDGQLDSTAE